LEKAARPRGVIGASAPPAITTSAVPYWMARIPSPMQLAPVAQAVTTAAEIPRAPVATAISPEAMFASMAGAR